MPTRKRRIDRGLHFLQRRGLNKGVLGSSRRWFWVFLITLGMRRFRRMIGSEYETVWQGEVRPGEVLQIGHVAETYQGRPVRSRRREPTT